MVLQQLVTTLIARSAKQYEDPAGYIMTMTAPSVLGFDGNKPEGKKAKIAFEHGVSFCNGIETAALDLLKGD